MRRKKPGLVAVALCLGGALTACGGGGDGEGYAAVGAAHPPKGAAGPSGAVVLVPLESPTAPALTSSTSFPSPAPPGASPSTDGAAPVPSGTSTPRVSSRTDPGAESGAGTATGSGPTAAPGSPGRGTGSTAPSTGGGTPSRAPSRTPSVTPGPTPPGTPTPSPTPTTAPGPAVLTVSSPVLADGDRRWCERVTVTFRNTGGSTATSGTVTFATHVIGALGTDWATVTTQQPLPAPIAAGAARTHTYTVCVDSWRVPLGMRVETRKVTVAWQ
ncbi:hypothetical protein ACFW2Y_17015 [Streptomyces sp. NPDC058877]|uniref:hypothetical protein n=1 Tax=unclassified Streptomyces TaxID=2593676 RepID=UPI0036AECC25